MIIRTTNSDRVKSVLISSSKKSNPPKENEIEIIKIDDNPVSMY